MLESLGFVLCCKFDQVASLAVTSSSDMIGNRGSGGVGRDLHNKSP